MIEKGRHRNLDKWERFCPFCPTLIENEIHFLLYCKTFRCLREELFTKICTYSPTFTPLPEKDKFVHLLNDELAIPYVGNFLRKAFECRSFLLGKHKNREWMLPGAYFIYWVIFIYSVIFILHIYWVIFIYYRLA